MAPNSDKSISMDIRQKAGVSFAASLTFENIHHSYHSEPVLCGIDLTVKPGEVMCLLGPSGSGKTTLLRLAAGIEVQSQGRLLLNGQEIANPKKALPPEKRGIGLMFQDFALFPHMTILDNTKFGLTALSADEAEKQAILSLRRVGLEQYQNAYPHLLSGGEQQRAALARAIAPRPSVLLMDEPFSGLDSRLKEVVRSDTLSILREARATSIIVTHDADEAMQVADRIALLKDGKLVQVGTGRDLYQTPKDLFTASFFSDLNVLSATTKSGKVDTPVGVVDAAKFADGIKLDVAIRHSGVMVDTKAGGMPARIITRKFVGRLEQLQLAVSGTDNLIHASIRAGNLPQSASDVFLKINDQDVFLFESSA
ncbi:ABC transporter ATP-binding protein [Lentilitoribacter sp. Alg239-R112]|uniref:ABC transporter ATP-binding protein n=1 Tax=Lentilitoribacter sp. Alg239-R112 TaxID=2305987 RepID=UPI0013A68E83|nr:ABC transporter ATP-binding protein [Lentilitoribacter sp. Alg239-R112]